MVSIHVYRIVVYIMDISMDIDGKYVDMGIDIKFHIHDKPALPTPAGSYSFRIKITIKYKVLC